MSRPFEARYEGTCAGCRDEILPGEAVLYDNDQLVHQGHESRRAAVRTVVEVPCPTCFLVHGGECDR